LGGSKGGLSSRAWAATPARGVCALRADSGAPSSSRQLANMRPPLSPSRRPGRRGARC
jgi:hypothetical protein